MARTVSVNDLAQKFYDEDFRSLSFDEDGTISIIVGGCLHASANATLADYCTATKCHYPLGMSTLEEWVLTPDPEHRLELTAILVAAWRRFLVMSDAPDLTIANVNGMGWGKFTATRTHDQVKLAINLLCSGRSLKVHPDQDAAKAAYGQANVGDILVQVDGKPCFFTAKGYLVNTLTANTPAA